MSTTYKGIDVSKWQGAIDWKKVKASGIQFAMIRISYGTRLDRIFEYNYKEAKAAGLPIGVYVYSIASSVDAAEKEADFVISALKGKKLEYPVAFDIEDNKIHGSMSKAKRTNIINAFCKRMKAAGFYACVYSSKSWFENKIDVKALKDFDIWLAQWNSKCTYKGEYSIWQYSDSGKVNGIVGNVDMDYSYKNYPQIMKDGNWNGYKKADSQPAEKPKLKTIDVIAQEVLNGLWGNGATRKKKLAEAGYDADAVQARVNQILEAQKAAEKAEKKHVKAAKIKLNDAPVYASATAKTASTTKTGTFYIYDGIAVNNRYRITNKKTYCGKTPIYQFVTGWVELK